MNGISKIIAVISILLLANVSLEAGEYNGAKRLNELTGLLGGPSGYSFVVNKLPAVLDSIGAVKMKKSEAAQNAFSNLIEKLIERDVPINNVNNLQVYNDMGRISTFIDSTKLDYHRILIIELLYKAYQKLYDLYLQEYKDVWKKYRNDEILAAEASRLAQTYDQSATLMQKGKAVAYTVMLANIEPVSARRLRLRAWKFLSEKVDEFPPGAIVQQLAILEKMERLAAKEKVKEIARMANNTIAFIKAEQKGHPDQVGIADKQAMPGKSLKSMPLQQQGGK